MNADAIMGVTFFSDVAPDDFATFDRAFFALVRLSGGETWLDSLQRWKEDGTLNYGPNLFVFSYIVIVVWVLLQVSVAVLLDNFVSYTMKEEDLAKLQQQQEGKSKCENKNPLEPLLQKLLKGFVDDADLTAKIQIVYQVIPGSELFFSAHYALTASMGRRLMTMATGGSLPPSFATGSNIW